MPFVQVYSKEVKFVKTWLGFKLILLLCIRLMRDLIGQGHSINIQEQRKLT